MIVVDASVFVETLLRTDTAAVIDKILFDPRRSLHAPHLIDVEVAQVVRRYVVRRDIEEERGRVALAVLADLPITRYPHDFLLPRIWSLRNNLTAYDAAYVALAEALDAPLLTRDARIAAAAGHRARIEVV